MLSYKKESKDRSQRRSSRLSMKHRFKLAKQNKATVFDKLYALLKKNVKDGEAIKISDVHRLYEKFMHFGKTVDCIMYNVIKKFNEQDQAVEGAYAHYRKQERRIVFTSIDKT